jgi:protein-S-isoprenylcysteine O-methyltransferase Ste14
LTTIVLICASTVARLLDEERHLRERLPGYDVYSRKVRYRPLPRIG